MAAHRSNGRLRLPAELFVFAAVLIGTTTRPARAGNPFLGVWQGGTMMDTDLGKVPIQIRLTFLSDGTYWQETGTQPRAGTMQGGHYKILPKSMLHLSVEKWAPKGPRPPGSLFHYQFLDANTLFVKDANFGGTVTFKRIK